MSSENVKLINGKYHILVDGEWIENKYQDTLIMKNKQLLPVVSDHCPSCEFKGQLNMCSRMPCRPLRGDQLIYVKVAW